MMRVNTASPIQNASMAARIERWWKAKTQADKRSVTVRALLGGLCFATLMVGFPMLSGLNSVRIDAAELRDKNLQLAQIQDAGQAVRADVKASALLEHDWLRTVEYSLERNPSLALSPHTAFERDHAALSGLTRIDIPKRSDAEELLRQKECLANAIYYEARSERLSGQLAVAEVIMNRVKDHRYPNSICEVVFQGATRTTGCQFTFTCDGAMRRTPHGSRWEKAHSIAAHVIMDLNERKTHGATHYHATYVNPVWNSGLIRTEKIGTHIFYRFPRGSEWTVATARQNERLGRRRAGLKTITPAKVKVTATPQTLGATDETDVHIGTH